MAGNFARLVEAFPFLETLDRGDADRLAGALRFPTLEPGQVAYEPGWPCNDYLMCVHGQTRIFKTNESGREMLLYKVERGGTCVLTTQCLLARTTFPAGSIAETPTLLAALPAASFHRCMEDIPAFRDFVITDYTKLLATMLSFVDSLAFQTIEQRLARRLLVEAGESLLVETTHQQLASDIGSVREIVSRHLGEWERHGWVQTSRGQVRILDRAALVSRQAPDQAVTA